jgi:hypothetical protein
MRDHQGWLGVMRELLYYLSVVGCDRDPGPNGRYHVDGNITTFMGATGENAEVCVGADAVYYVGGQPKNLAAGLSSTSYGLKVTVL